VVRSFISYILAAAFVVLMMDVIAPPAGFGLAVGAWPSVDGHARSQIVDRTHKGDKLQFPAASDRRTTPSGNPAMLIGCEPVFSSLSSGARANFAGRCVA
jgi:hypothetical protein